MHRLFGWLEYEGEIDASPMAKMRPPQVPENAVPAYTEDELQAFLKATEAIAAP